MAWLESHNILPLTVVRRGRSANLVIIVW
jgi:hypothetical protein